MNHGFGTQLLCATILASGMAVAPASAERILRADEAPVVELDPAKGMDYGDTVLATNLYDSLVNPAQGASGVQPQLATGWSIDGAVCAFSLRDDVTFNSGNPLTAADVVYSFKRLMASGHGHSGLFEGVVDSVEAQGRSHGRLHAVGTFQSPARPAGILAGDCVVAGNSGRCSRSSDRALAPSGGALLHRRAAGHHQ